jgi:malate dehydrogenase
VLITGAAGQIAYSLAFAVARGDLFTPRPGASTTPSSPSPSPRVLLHLRDVPGTETRLEGLVMELEDCAFDSLAGVVATSDYAVAFQDVDVALLVGARPRGPGMERSDLLAANAAIFAGQGDALDKYAKKSVLVLVVGNPANTNALIAATHAPSIPRENFTALTRLDLNRARALLAGKVGVAPTAVKNVIIWGNHSTTQYADARMAMVARHARGHDSVSVQSLLGDAGREWMRGEFLATIQQRGKTVIDKRGASSAASAANAICDHVRDLWLGSQGDLVSMGVYVAGAGTGAGAGTPYGVSADLIYSLPVVCDGKGKYRVVKDLTLDAFSAEMVSGEGKGPQEEVRSVARR